jgi:plasmid stabilization system protein ParE
MVVKILWTKRAQKSFDNIVSYLENKWSIHSAIKFVRKTNSFIKTLQSQPYIGKPEGSKNDLRGFVLSRYTTVFYRVKNPETIILLNFFDTRQHPDKKFK